MYKRFLKNWYVGLEIFPIDLYHTSYFTAKPAVRYKILYVSL